jgi:uncharacterized protein (TIGR00290 family)
VKPRAAVSWSGGKDSCAALMRTCRDFDVVAMLTMADESASRSRSHGLRPEMLDAHATRLGLRRLTGRCTWATYTAVFGELLDAARADGVTHVIFGDILDPDHRAWAEAVCAPHGLVAVEPLFGRSTTVLFDEWIDSGSRAAIVTARAAFLGPEWLGRTLSAAMRPEFERLGVDPCGERGEYHTYVIDCPLFASPVPIVTGSIVERGGCHALDLRLASVEVAAP